MGVVDLKVNSSSFEMDMTLRVKPDFTNDEFKVIKEGLSGRGFSIQKLPSHVAAVGTYSVVYKGVVSNKKVIKDNVLNLVGFVLKKYSELKEGLKAESIPSA